jgi:hypothetical protein
VDAPPGRVADRRVDRPVRGTAAGADTDPRRWGSCLSRGLCCWAGRAAAPVSDDGPSGLSRREAAGVGGARFHRDMVRSLSRGPRDRPAHLGGDRASERALVRAPSGERRRRHRRGDAWNEQRARADVADKVAALKGTEPEGLQERLIASTLTSEMVRTYGAAIPSSVAGSSWFMLCTVFFPRHHLPGGYLRAGVMPFLVSTNHPYVAVLVPERYWPKPRER